MNGAPGLPTSACGSLPCSCGSSVVTLLLLLSFEAASKDGPDPADCSSKGSCESPLPPTLPMHSCNCNCCSTSPPCKLPVAELSASGSAGVSTDPYTWPFASGWASCAGAGPACFTPSPSMPCCSMAVAGGAFLLAAATDTALTAPAPPAGAVPALPLAGRIVFACMGCD